GEGGGGEMGDAAPSVSKHFAVRGHITYREGEAPPTQAGEALVYSDPQIASMLTCGGSPPLGNAANVATNLHAAQLHAKHLDGTGVAVAVVDTGINLQHLQTNPGHMPTSDPPAPRTPPAPP